MLTAQNEILTKLQAKKKKKKIINPMLEKHHNKNSIPPQEIWKFKKFEENYLRIGPLYPKLTLEIRLRPCI